MIVNKASSSNTTFKGIFDANLLVTGSSGYIGSHLIPELVSQNYNCIICCRNQDKKDYLERAIDYANKQKKDKSLCSFSNIDLTDESALNKLLQQNKPIDGVIHLSGSTYNSESIINPRKYYDNNVLASRNLINSMLDNDIKNILYLSTASIYTNNVPYKVTEEEIPLPKTPYAKTKYMAEQMINDYKVYGLKPFTIRLFNAAGACGTKDLDIGKNVITVLLNLIKDDRVFTLMGNNYPTFDGTCVKDFIHIDDITKAIAGTLNRLLDKGVQPATYNLGSGCGTSLGEIIKKSIDITGRKLKLRIGDPLSNEVPSLVANITKIQADIDWKPQKNIDDIIKSSWKWILGGKK